ncbi:hypothetical protein Patl1_32617 [Pistacia atlantica]|uniref:Uncharacterized protein n=1 Tax=Pistacia atlantica TaxID=434234 RepID=A0ACC1AR79_9ROSI|nr:hypothetical protein Patl1_32617 [Pistacia atlantica]
MFSASILLQILACAIYSNWWPMLSALMYVLVPMPCLFFGGGSTQFLTSRDGGGGEERAWDFYITIDGFASLEYRIFICLDYQGYRVQQKPPVKNLFNIIEDLMVFSWIDAAKFLTGASAVGSLAIPIILRHAHMIETGAMFIEFTSFVIFVCTVLCFHRASLEDEW